MATAVSAPVINSIFSIDPVSKEQSDQFWESVWKVAQYASIAFFIIGSTGGFVFTSIYYPSQVFGVVLAIFTIGLYYATQLGSYLYNKSAAYGNSAIAQGKLVKQLNLVTDEKLKEVRDQFGVPEVLSQSELKVGLARYLSLKEEQANLLERRRVILEKHPDSPSAGNIDWKDEKALNAFETAQEVRVASRTLEDRAALTNVMAAHTLMLLRSPHENKSVGDYCQFNPFQAAPLLIAKGQGDTSTEVLVKTKARNYTANELLKKDTAALAREIFSMPSSPSTSRWSFSKWKSS